MQDQIRLKVFQGESRRVKDNFSLGELLVTGIPPSRESQAVRVRFTYDLNGILEVEAIVEATQKRFRVVLANHAGHLDKSEIEAAVRKMQAVKFYPRDDIANRKLLLFAERVVGETPPDSRETLEFAMDLYEKSMSSGDRAEFDIARANLLGTLEELGFEYSEGNPGADDSESENRVVDANDRTLKYLKRALTLDPYTRGGDIVRLRGKFHRSPVPEDVRGDRDGGGDFQRQHASAHRRLAGLRGRFWELPAALLNSTLAAIDTKRFPDLAGAVARLKVVAAVRDEFKREDPQDTANPGVWDLLRVALVAEAGQAADARRKLEGKAVRSTYRGVIVRAVEHVRVHAPDVYALEQDWFDGLRRGKGSAAATLLGAAGRTSSSANRSAPTEAAEGGVGGWAVMVGIGVLLGIVRILISGGGKTPPTPNRPVVSPPSISFPANPGVNPTPPVYDPSMFVPSSPTIPDTRLPPGIESPFGPEAQKNRERKQQESLEAMQKRMREAIKSPPRVRLDTPFRGPDLPKFNPPFPGPPLGPNPSSVPPGAP